MESVIQQQLNGQPAEELVEVTVEGVPCPRIEGLTDKFSSLARLSIVNCGLTTLEGLPSLPKLNTLLLGDNKLSGAAEIATLITSCPQLLSLSLVGNRFKSLDDLQDLSKLTDLKDLDLFNCPVTAVEGYRERVFKLLPDLKSLDGFDQNGQEVNPPGEEDDEDDEEEEEEEEEGPGLEYLQQDILDSDDEEADFDPDAEGSPGSEDYTIEEEEEDEGEEGDKGDDAPGPSKRARLDPPVED